MASLAGRSRYGLAPERRDQQQISVDRCARPLVIRVMDTIQRSSSSNSIISHQEAREEGQTSEYVMDSEKSSLNVALDVGLT